MYFIRKIVHKFTPWMLAVVLCSNVPSVSFADASSASLSIKSRTLPARSFPMPELSCVTATPIRNSNQ